MHFQNKVKKILECLDVRAGLVVWSPVHTLRTLAPYVSIHVFVLSCRESYRLSDFLSHGEVLPSPCQMLLCKFTYVSIAVSMLVAAWCVIGHAVQYLSFCA